MQYPNLQDYCKYLHQVTNKNHKGRWLGIHKLLNVFLHWICNFIFFLSPYFYTAFPSSRITWFSRFPVWVPSSSLFRSLNESPFCISFIWGNGLMSGCSLIHGAALCRFPWRSKQLSMWEHLAFEVSNLPSEPSVLSVLHQQQYHMGIKEAGTISNYFHRSIAGWQLLDTCKRIYG